MKKLLKEIFNFRTILSCYIGAIGYGVGYNLPSKLGWHMIICLVCCLVLGSLFDALAKKITSSAFFEKSLKNKIITAVYVYGGYLLAWLIVDRFLQYDLDYDFLYNIGFIVIIQIVLMIKNAMGAVSKEKTETQENK